MGLTSSLATSVLACETTSPLVFLWDKIKKQCKHKLKPSHIRRYNPFFHTYTNILLLPVMRFPSRLILSSVAISISLSGKMEKPLLARLMLVKCSISPTASGSLVRTLPCRSSSGRYFKTQVNRRVPCLFFHHGMTSTFV